jgi:homoserine dehydrogenase
MKQVSVMLFGAGGVGQALLTQIVNGRTVTALRNNCHLNVVCVADSQSYAWAAAGLSDAQLQGIIAAKRQGQPVNVAQQGKRPSNLELLAMAEDSGTQNLILADVTAAAGMEPLLNAALMQGHRAVLANKKPLAGPWATAQPFFNHLRLRHESTVGGGQPVIATLRYLLDVNDPILEITGQLSGSLGFICQQLDQDTPFSVAIAAAKAKGYTEPDPRDDLGGQDVMRKILILGRMAGWPLEAGDIQVESLYPAAMAHLSVVEFMAQLEELDEEMRARVATAVAQQKTLRYVARVTPQGGAVSLQALPVTSPLANMKYISFRSGLYHDEPLLIGGKGAGVEMTAAGVLGDILDLVRETVLQ